MKKKILGLLPLMVLMFLMSCSDDDFKEENLSYSLKNNNRLNFVNTIGESDLQRENPTLYQSLESINRRSVDSGNDMLEIDLKKINKIELDSATSYVFRIKFLDQPENKFVDNMVYTRYYDRKEYVSWLRYDFDENDKSSIIERNLIRNFSDKLGLIGVGTTLNEDVHLYESFSFLSTENEDDCLITIPDAGSTLHTCYPYDGSDPYSWTGSESHGCNGDLEHTVQDLVLVDYFCHLSGGGAGDNPGDGYGGSPGPSFPGVPPSGGGSSGGGSGGDPTAPGQGYPDPEDPSQEFPILTDGNGTIISFPNIELPEPPEDDEEDCEASEDDVMELFPNANEQDVEKLVSLINEYGFELGINTEAKLQHFLSQIGHETGGLTTLNVTESTYWSTASLLADTFTMFTMDSSAASNDSNLYYAPDFLQDSEGVANIVYCCRMCNGSVSSGDGYRYRGRGVLQLTGKCNYENFEVWYNDFNESNIDILNSPDLIQNNENLAILSGLWYFKENVLDRLNENELNVFNVSRLINHPAATNKKQINGYSDREDRFELAEEIINCN